MSDIYVSDIVNHNHKHFGCGAQNAFKIQTKCIFVNPSTCTYHISKKPLNIRRFEKNIYIFQRL
jgi:hypothetical protein